MLMTIMVKTDAQMGVMPIRLLTRQYHNPNLKSPFFLSLTGKSLSLSPCQELSRLPRMTFHLCPSLPNWIYVTEIVVGVQGTAEVTGL